MSKVILVPLDGSEVAASILQQVVAMARSAEARLILLTVGLPLPVPPAQASEIAPSRTFQAEVYMDHIRTDTVGQPPGAEICVSNMPSLKAKKFRKLSQEKVLLELGCRLANSIRTYLANEGLEVSTLVCIGDPATEILRCAAWQQVDRIVINSRGGGGSPLPFLGSVAAKVAGAAMVPVTVFYA
jgi:nucleotide-binding universal stress UspA family protein